MEGTYHHLQDVNAQEVNAQAVSASKTITKRLIQFLFGLILLVSGYFLLFPHAFDITWVHNNLHMLRSLAQSHFILALCLFFLIRFFFAIVSIPGSGVLTVVAGALFDFMLAYLLVTVSVSLGVLVVFLLSRYALRDYVKWKFNNRPTPFSRILGDHSASLLFLIRVTGVVPAFIVNSFFALTAMKASTYFWVSFVGFLPGIFILTNAGHQISSISQVSDLMTPGVMLSLAAIGILPFISSIFYKLIFEKEGVDDGF